ncbi:isopeptide-forming domain-containing fimbrial protein, partial [Ilumatobacter sp.]|uniref:isopeptide-forming domain-containing fimbrial protein n=1 Tax=Ilumatobacter sp. TaxID=1967498 RepID=UPI003B5176E9
TFDNVSATDTGYTPYIDLVLPTTGADGDDGVSFDGASFLGTAVTTTEVVFEADGEAEHPLAVDSSGDPLVVSGTPGDTLVVIELPYGSFSAGNPAVDVVVTLDFSDHADLDHALTLAATPGFALGNDALDNPSSDPSIVGTTKTHDVEQSLFTLTKANDIPEDEAATGASYVYTHTITVDVADGQTLSDFTLTDTLPPEMVYRGNLQAGGGTVVAEPTEGAIAGPGNDTLEIEFDTISGTVDVSFDFHVAEVAAEETAPVIDRASGDQVAVVNTVTGGADWDPVDPDDAVAPVTATARDEWRATSLAIQKSVAVAADNQIPGQPTPEDVYDFTLQVQVSDFFAYGDLVVTDVLGDGWEYVAGSAEFTTVEEAGSVPATRSLTAQETSTRNDATGRTTNVWDLSAAMIAAGRDGLLTGGSADGSEATSNTRATITYQARVLDQYDDDGEDRPEIGQGDRIGNDVQIAGSVRNNATPTQIDGDETNASAAGVTIPFGRIEENTVYALDGATNPPSDAVVSAGDTVTFRILYDAPLGSFEDLRIRNNLPQNVFDVTEITTVSTTKSAAPPPAGTLYFGPADEYVDAGGPTPTMTFDAGSNGFDLDFGDFSSDPREQVSMELLFTVTVKDAVFAPQLLLTNQATEFEENSFGEEESSIAIAQFTYAEPVLEITKGIVATDSDDPDVMYLTATGSDTSEPRTPVPFSEPGSEGTRFSGTISSDGLAARPIDSDLLNVDAGDLVTFALTVENTGSASDGAFDIRVEDVVPEGFVVPTDGAGLNLSVTDGTGAAIAYTGDLFSGGIELTDPAVDRGAVAAFDETSGRNVAVVTYDLLLEDTVRADQTLQSEGAITNYTAFDGAGADRAADDLSDGASVKIEDAEVERTLVGREFGAIGTTSVLVGEEFTFRLTYDLAEATYENVFLSDTVRAGKSLGDYDILSASVVTWDATTLTSSNGVTSGTAGVVAADRESVTFDVGRLTVASDNDPTNDVIEIEVVARSSDANGASAGDRLSGEARFAADGVASTKASDVRLREPDLVMAKEAGSDVVAAGSTVSYSVVVEHGADPQSAPAYDLVLTDAVDDPNVAFDAESVTVTLDGADVTADAVVTGNGSGDRAVRVETDALARGGTLVVAYTATVKETVSPSVTISNTAELTYDSLPTDDADDERDGAETAQATTTSAPPEVTVAVVDSSQPLTPGATLSVGETVTFEIVAGIPEGTTEDAVLTNTLPAGLDYVSSTVVRVGDGEGSVTSTKSPTEGTQSGQETTFDFGDLTNPVNSADDDEIVVRVVARVTDAAAGTLTDEAALSFATGADDASTDVTVVEPSLDVTKAVSPDVADAGDTVSYTVRSTNGGTGPAYDVVIETDLTEAGVAAKGGTTPTIRILDGGTDVTPAGADAPSVAYPDAGGGLTATVPVLEVGQAVVIVYEAVVTDAAAFSSEVDASATVTRYDTAPGDGAQRVYDENRAGHTPPEDDATFTTPDASIARTILSTTDPDTDLARVGIGEEVVHRLAVTVPQGTADLTVTDAMPDGLAVVSARVVSLGGATSATLAEGATDASDDITVSTDGDGVTFDLGTTVVPGSQDAAAADTTLVLEVVTRVEDVPGNTAGTARQATARLEVDDAAANELQPDATAAETLTVVEPDVTVVLAGPEVAKGGDTLTYTLTLANEGDGPAHDLMFADLLTDPQLAYVPGSLTKAEASTATGDLTAAASGAGFEATLDTLEAGETLVVTYQAT